jgi:hypothetical protein
MRLPRMTTRRWMVAVACVAVALALRIAKERRIADFVRTAEFHEKQAARLRRSHHELGWIKTPPLTDKEIEILYYHNWLSIKYRTAASRPWLPVKPDPPEPR